MQPIGLRDLRYCVEVARRQGFSAAPARLSVRNWTTRSATRAFPQPGQPPRERRVQAVARNDTLGYTPSCSRLVPYPTGFRRTIIATRINGSRFGTLSDAPRKNKWCQKRTRIRPPQRWTGTARPCV